jgi:quercetin dioxygenase-like cupin family protein
MKHARLDDMTKGWFVGAFAPTACHTDACEVAVKHYKAGDKEQPHFHKIATETTLILSGTVVMAGREWQAGDIIVMEPGDVTGFEAITDTVNVVVKTPGALDDKYTA